MQTYLRLFLKFIGSCTAALCCLFFVFGQGHAASAPGPDGYGYLTGQATYDWVDISASGTPVTLSDDHYVGPFNAGFTFSFYGVDYTQFYINSNGTISFGAGIYWFDSSCPLPNANLYVNYIAMMASNLDPSSGGNVYHQSYVAGSCPYDSYSGACLVVQFQDIPPCCGNTSPASTFEGILFENNSMVIQFKESEVINWGSGSTTGIEGDNFAADHGLSYACNTAGSLYAGLAVEFSKTVKVVDLSPGNNELDGCRGKINKLDYNLKNYNNAGEIAFSLSYDVTSNNGTLTGPATVSVADDSFESFQVGLIPSGQIGDVVTATVTATGGGKTQVSDITMTITSGTFQPIADEPDNGRRTPVVAAYGKKIWSIAGTGFGTVAPVRTYDPKTNAWTDVSDSEAPFGNASIRSGCQVADTVYMFVNNVADQGLYSYNMTTNTWQDFTSLAGQPVPADTELAYGAWAYDDEVGLCYLTGGRLNNDPWVENSVFVFDPAAQQWGSPLPSFEHGRYSHAAWMVGSGATKKLCVAGGAVDLSGVMTEEEKIARRKTTQCYSFAQAAWNAENADLGPLPEPLAAMGYAKKKNCSSSEELWLVGGADAWTMDLTDKSRYYDFQAGTWLAGPSLSQASGACGAVILDNQLYKISGYDHLWSTSGVSERLEMCKGCFSWPKFIPAITGMGRD